MDRMGLKEGEVIQHSMMTKSIERAQKKVEENNFGIRKRLLEYDDVMNSQREIVYKQRRHALNGERLKVDIFNMIYDTAEVITENNKLVNDFKGFEFDLIKTFNIDSSISEDDFKKQNVLQIASKVYKAALEHYHLKTQKDLANANPVIKQVYLSNNGQFERIVVPFSDGNTTMNVVTNLEKAYQTAGKSLITDFEKNVTLGIVDEAWKKHLRKMDEMKQAVQLAVHEQKDPLLIYKFEAFKLFKEMIEKVNKDIVGFLFKGEVPVLNIVNEAPIEQKRKSNYTESKEGFNDNHSEELIEHHHQNRPKQETVVRDQPKINRNDNVTIKHIMSGKTETMKYKKAEPMVISGEWVIVNN
jgi:preprotein translocase subunit SecA